MVAAKGGVQGPLVILAVLAQPQALHMSASTPAFNSVIGSNPTLGCYGDDPPWGLFSLHTAVSGAHVTGLLPQEALPCLPALEAVLKPELLAELLTRWSAPPPPHSVLVLCFKPHGQWRLCPLAFLLFAPTCQRPTHGNRISHAGHTAHSCLFLLFPMSSSFLGQHHVFIRMRSLPFCLMVSALIKESISCPALFCLFDPEN